MDLRLTGAMPMGLFDSSGKDAPLVIDASVTINLSASGIGGVVLKRLERRIIVADVILEELRNNPPAGRDDAGQLGAWIESGLIKEVPIASIDNGVFLDLVAGSAGDTLDDGEAATIAIAVAHSAAAVLDERKALRIGSARYPGLVLASTTDLFLDDGVRAAIGEATLADALFSALTGARMRVLEHHVDDVVQLLGPDRVELCFSLPLSVRRRL